MSAGRIAIHRRVGMLGVLLALLFIGEGYVMSVEAARRGFNLTQTVNAQGDPVGALVTRLGLFLESGVLVLIAVLYRRRSGIHKRLLLFATVGSLAPRCRCSSPNSSCFGLGAVVDIRVAGRRSRRTPDAFRGARHCALVD